MNLPNYLCRSLALRSLIFLLLTLATFQGFTQEIPNRQMVITIDDLPVITRIRGIEHKKEVTRKLLATLQAYKAPAIGFVNEGKLYRNGKKIPAMTQLLQQWLNAGIELGNHGYGHIDYHKVTMAEFEKEIIDGEATTNELLAESGKKMTYFRHPFLHTGNSEEKHVFLKKFLKERGYIEAPVTVDNSDWIYAKAYDDALTAKDSAMMKKIGESYVQYMEEKIVYFERNSRDLFGREIPQILLIHANTINSDYLDDLIEMMQDRNYSMVSLEEALKDEAYESEDTYYGMAGITWLHRWALTLKKEKDFYKGEPMTPQFIQDYSGIKE